MANGKQKLELTWIGKDIRPKLEPRILIEDPAKSYHANFRTAETTTPHKAAPAGRAQNAASSASPRDDLFDNRLIFGDNLLALKAMEQEFTGKIKCIYIDPPYNTGSAFTHYDDGVEHSIWLSLMRERLEILHRLLTSDGVIWVTIDDKEGHYLKILMDEVFGRKSFVSSVVWENFYGRSNAAAISPSHNYLLVYSPLGQDWKQVRRLLPRDEKSASKYQNPDNDLRGPWRLGPIFAAEERHEGLMYSIKTPSGRSVRPPKGSHWRMVKEEFWRLVEDKRIAFGVNGDNVPAIKLYLNEVQQGLVPRSWWPHTEVGHTQEAKREIQAIFPDVIPFDTPKPERLLHRVIEMSSNPGDWVLDSFAGSGTTGAVAHKMGRKWIMVELGEHCHTHIIPRLKKVIDGTDPGGITESVGWQGGGGFRYYRVGPSLLELDKFGNLVISKEFNSAMLAEAMCKLEGFIYAPSATDYWQHGHSTENDFIFVTTQTLSYEQLAKISEDVGPNRTLLICCSAFRGTKAGDFPNLTVKKIPKAVLSKCEWGHDDYSLEIQNLPMKAPAESNAGILPAPETDGTPPPRDGTPRPRTKAQRRKQAANNSASLFDTTDTSEDVQ